jgi:hypothetical protein
MSTPASLAAPPGAVVLPPLAVVVPPLPGVLIVPPLPGVAVVPPDPDVAAPPAAAVVAVVVPPVAVVPGLVLPPVSVVPAVPSVPIDPSVAVLPPEVVQAANRSPAPRMARKFAVTPGALGSTYLVACIGSSTVSLYTNRHGCGSFDIKPRLNQRLVPTAALTGATT